MVKFGPKSLVTNSNTLFCLTNSQKTKYIQFYNI